MFFFPTSLSEVCRFYTSLSSSSFSWVTLPLQGQTSLLLWSLHRSPLHSRDRLLGTSLLLWSLHRSRLRSRDRFLGTSLLLRSLQTLQIRSHDRLFRTSLVTSMVSPWVTAPLQGKSPQVLPTFVMWGSFETNIFFEMIFVYRLELRCVELLANVTCVCLCRVFFVLRSSCVRARFFFCYVSYVPDVIRLSFASCRK